MESRMIVRGKTTDKRTFRPSDWVERVAACCASFTGDRRLRYLYGLEPVLIDNEKYLSVHLSLEDTHPEIWAFVMEFINTNKLIMSNHDDEVS